MTRTSFNNWGEYVTGLIYCYFVYTFICTMKCVSCMYFWICTVDPMVSPLVSLVFGLVTYFLVSYWSAFIPAVVLLRFVPLVILNLGGVSLTSFSVIEVYKDI